MLENFTLDMVLLLLTGRNMLCYHMVQTLQKWNLKKALQKRLN